MKEDGVKPHLKILAFGDSLTEGYFDHGMAFHPYSGMLQKLLKEDAGLDVKVDQQGVSGERVLQGMVHRLPKLLKEAEAQGVKYDWCVIMGGINDLGWRSPPDHVFNGLLMLYRACGEHGAKVLALTCLETFYSRAGQEDERNQLNALIRGVHEAGGEGPAAEHKYDFVKVLDAEPHFPFVHSIPKHFQSEAERHAHDKMVHAHVARHGAHHGALHHHGGGGHPHGTRAERDSARLWGDHLHLTPHGYDKLGQLVYDTLKDELKAAAEAKAG